MPFANLFIVTGTAVLALMIAVWMISLIVGDASIVDIFWGIGFILVTLITFHLSQGYLPRKQLIAVLVIIWGLRLALHIGFRNWGNPEDFRYAQWRRDNGPRWWWLSLFQVFLLQGILMWIISAPLITVQTSNLSATLTPLDLLGASFWTLGLMVESMADLQLTRFKADPANTGRLLTHGFWRYSRHPNYFGEAVVWWGFYIIALATGSWWTIFSPIIMSYLLINVSGVAMLERTMKLKPGYAEYMRKTSAFIPWFPRS